MSCSVNLVPVARLQARARLRRRASWVVACGIGVTGCASGWGLLYAARASVARAVASVHGIEVQCADVQRRIVAAGAQRDRLIERVNTLAAARRAQPWPARLVTLARETPDGVFLTGIQVEPIAAAVPTNMPEPPRAAPSAAKSPTPQADPVPSAPVELRSVRLLGYAIDHAALLQFHNVVQRLPGLQQVELVRAVQEPFGATQAVAFEMDCRTREDTP